MGSKNVKFIETERKSVIRAVEKWGDIDQRVQNFNCKMNKF
jgi:hypothetical protein